MKKRGFLLKITAYGLLLGLLTGCGEQAAGPSDPGAGASQAGQESVPSDAADESGGGGSLSLPVATRVPVSGESSSGEDADPGASVDDPAVPASSGTGSRDSTPLCLVPRADGTAVIGNDVAQIDYSNASEGYICASYTGSCPKVKFRIVGSDGIQYTYDLHGNGFETFPLSSGDGFYDVFVFENITGNQYSTCIYDTISVDITNDMGPFLYPNQYVNFTPDSATVAKGAELAKGAKDDLEVIANVYNYMIRNITYDYNKASDPPTGYTTNVDEILNSKTGICLDYAAVMASMLRSQRIPTRLEVGYAADVYHAWISIYVHDVGWLNGVIEFDGMDWTLVDPTFGASTGEADLKKFIGDGSNYTVQKIY